MDGSRVLREAALVAAVAAFQLFTAEAGGERAEAVPLDAAGLALLLAGPLVLPLRHRAPAFVVAVGLLAAIVYFPLGYPGAAIFASVVVALVSMRRRQVAEQRHALVAEQARKAAEERLAISRDLHDVLGHTLSVVQVQAGVALHLMDTHPDRVRDALTAVQTASGEGMRELRSAVAALRHEEHGPGAPLAPAPGLDELPALVARTRAAGVTVRFERTGAQGPVAPAASLAAYRVVQEALTNVVRHSGATCCEVRVDVQDSLTVSIEDDGRGVGAGASGQGNGLLGMRERVAAAGGLVQAGPLPGGGYRIHADLPL